MFAVSRRQFLASTAAALGASAAGLLKPGLFTATAAPDPDLILLGVESRTIEVLGKPARVFGLRQPNGASSIVTQAGKRFRVRLDNRIDAPTLVHWHGLLPPFGQDGVPDLPQPLLQSGKSYDYDFPLETPGTHWMHAHTLQEQQLLAAPLIVEDPAEAGVDEQQVVVLLHDFSFKTPEEILSGLQSGRGTQGGSMTAGRGGMAGQGAMPGAGAQSGMMSGMMSGMGMDINDIEYDAYLANDRTLDDPEVFRVEPGGTVRLRLINGATATAFWIDLGELSGEAIAVDGNPIEPVAGRHFPLGMGQRIDIRLALPNGQGAWPILALRQGATERTGFMLATRDGVVGRLGPIGDRPTPALDAAFEVGLRASRPLPVREADRQESVVLSGGMGDFVWTLNGRTWGEHRPIPVRAGDRVELALRNQSMMGHPMHLHGHHFQVVAVNGRSVPGAMRDTVWIPPMAELSIAFEAGNPGVWAFHCHHLYHMATGMMTSVDYGA